MVITHYNCASIEIFKDQISVDCDYNSDKWFFKRNNVLIYYWPVLNPKIGFLKQGSYLTIVIGNVYSISLPGHMYVVENIYFL